MTGWQIILDGIMCCMWMLTYTFVLIGTIKYQYPLISPITQAIIAPFEFSVLYLHIVSNCLGKSYASLAYIYWTFIEVMTIFVMIRKNYVAKKMVAGYLGIVCAFTCVLCYLVGHRNQMFFFSYLNTFVGIAIWLYHVLKKEYPMKLFALLAFIAKFIADAVAIPVYWGNSSWLMNVLCVFLPILDAAFIVVYFLRKNCRKK